MAKRIKFALKLKDDAEVRTLSELQEYFDIDRIMAYFLSGKLETWLKDRYYDAEADQVQELDKGDPDLSKKLCDIFGVEYLRDALTPEEIEARNKKIERLKEITDDEKILDKVDSVAFSQEELAGLLDKGLDTIYLCGDDFQIPRGKKNITYIGIQTVLTLTEEQREQCEKNGIRFIGLLKEEASGQEDEDSRLLCICTSEVGGKRDLLVCESQEKQEWKAGGIDTKPLYDLFESYKKFLHPEFQKGFVEIPMRNMTEILAASYVEQDILYVGVNEQGTFFGTMKLDGTQDRIVKYLPNGGNWLEYLFGRDYVIVSKRKEIMGSRAYFKINVEGIETEIEGCFDGFFGRNICEASNGVYSIDGMTFRDETSNKLERGIVVKELVSGESKIRRYQFKIDTTAWYAPRDPGKLRVVYSNRSLDKVYFLWGSRFESEVQIWFFDIHTKEITRVTSAKIGNFHNLFGIKGNEIFYYGSDGQNSYLKIMALDMVTGKTRSVWENLNSGLYGLSGEVIGKLKGDHIYFSNDFFTLNRIYKVKIDGTERTIIEGSSEIDHGSKLGRKIAAIKDWA